MVVSNTMGDSPRNTMGDSPRGNAKRMQKTRHLLAAFRTLW